MEEVLRVSGEPEVAEVKVSELIEVLKNYPKDAPVVALWDGGWANLDIHCLEKDRRGRKIVEFDVTEYGTYMYDE